MLVRWMKLTTSIKRSEIQIATRDTPLCENVNMLTGRSAAGISKHLEGEK